MATGKRTPRETKQDYSAKARAVRDNMYEIATTLSERARELVASGAELRSGKGPGLATIMFGVEKAINEILRVNPLCGDTEARTESDASIVLNFVGGQEPTTTVICDGSVGDA